MTFVKTPRQVEACAALNANMHTMLYGGSRCVSGDTILDGHTKTIKEMAEDIEMIMVMTSHGYQIADTPYKKGSCELLEINTSNGRKITVTPDHMFWGGDAWISAESLVRGSRIATLPNNHNKAIPQSEGRTFSRSGDIIDHDDFSSDIPCVDGYELTTVSNMESVGIQDYYTLYVPNCEQYYANGILHHNSGKTTITIRNIILRAIKKPSRHLVGRFRFNHAKTSLWYDTIPKVLKMSFPGLECKFNKSDWFITIPTQVPGEYSEIWLAGVDDKERVEKILGNEYSTIFMNECSQISHDSITMLRTRLAENSGLDLKFYYDCNPPGKKHWTYQEFVLRLIPGTKEPSTLDSGHLVINPGDNVDNLPDSYIDTLNSLPKKQRQRFLDGKFLSEIDGALWTFEMINGALGVDYGETIRTVVAVDPAVTENEDSDDTGIVVASTDGENALVEADYTLKASPNTWANKVIWAYDKHEAGAIVVETNQGGDMIETILRSNGFKGKIIKIHAKKGKALRAEPVSGLYEQGRVRHVEKGLTDLEDECQEWVPGVTKESPNRIDALVYAVTELILSKPPRERRAMVIPG